MQTPVYAAAVQPDIKTLSSSNMTEELESRGQDYHFWQIDRDPAFFLSDGSVMEEKDTESEIVGTFSEGDVCFILQEEGDWNYIESGNVRGFVLADVCSSEELDETKDKPQSASPNSKRSSHSSYAAMTVEAYENAAYTYVRSTTEQVIDDAKYALAKYETSIYEDMSIDSRAVGTLPEQGVMYVLEEERGWIFVESGDVRGYVLKSDVQLHATDTVADRGYDDYETADMLVEPEENAAFYHTKKTSVSGRPNREDAREEITAYALSFTNGKGTWNGYTLENGLDSAGVIRNIFKRYGIVLPATLQAQMKMGAIIPLSEAAPGDLLYYRGGEEITSVSMLLNEDEMLSVGEDGFIYTDSVTETDLAWCVRVIAEEEDAVSVTYTTPVSKDATVIIPGETCGGIYTYEKWDRVWAQGTNQRVLHDKYEAYDEEGFGRIEDRYVIACTTTFGRVGDMIDFELSDGTVIKTVVGDIKSQNDAGCNIYGHKNGRNVIEFIVLSSIWYNTGHANAGTPSCHPEWGGLTVTAAYNYGNILD